MHLADKFDTVVDWNKSKNRKFVNDEIMMCKINVNLNAAKKKKIIRKIGKFLIVLFIYEIIDWKCHIYDAVRPTGCIFLTSSTTLLSPVDLRLKYRFENTLYVHI